MDSFIKSISNFFSIAIIAAFAENLLLGHSLGFSQGYRYSKKLDQTHILWYGLLSTFMLIISSFPLHISTYFLSKYKYSFIFIPLVYIFLVAATYFAVSVVVKNYLPLFYPKIIKYLPISTFSTALIGGYILSQNGGYTKLYQTVGFCLGSGIGYTVATLLVIEGARKISTSDVPKPFRGLPVMAIYIGLLSLVVYGISRDIMV